MSNDGGYSTKTTTTITYSDNNTMNVMVPLIPFNCLFDTNVGLIKLINKEFRDPGVFDTNTLDSLDSNFKVVKFVYNSRSTNILLDIMLEKDEETAVDLYNQFMNQEYANILMNSVYTDLLGLLEMMLKQPDVKVTIFCLRKEEINFIHEYISKDIQAVLLDELIEHINIYKQFYFKNLLDDPYCLKIYKGINKKAVYILDYPKNFDKEGKFIETDIMKELTGPLGAHLSIINTFCYNFNKENSNVN